MEPRYLHIPPRKPTWPKWLGGIVAALFLISVLWPVSAQGTPLTLETRCMSSIKGLAIGAVLYASDNDDTLPSANWHDAIAKYGRHDWFSCPKIENAGKLGGYAYSKRAAGKKLADPEQGNTEIMFFETSTLGLNVVQDPIHVLATSRHEGLVNVVHMDTSIGHLKPIDGP